MLRQESLCSKKNLHYVLEYCDESFVWIQLQVKPCVSYCDELHTHLSFVCASRDGVSRFVARFGPFHSFDPAMLPRKNTGVYKSPPKKNKRAQWSWRNLNATASKQPNGTEERTVEGAKAWSLCLQTWVHVNNINIGKLWKLFYIVLASWHYLWHYDKRQYMV